VVSRRIVLRFPPSLVGQPVVCNLTRRYDLEFSILRALVTPNEEGLLVLEIKGSETACGEGMEYLAEVGVQVQPLSQDIIRDEIRCTHCGACVGVCPSRALSLAADPMEVLFDNAKCLACELCIRACPVRAMEVHF